MRTEYKRYNFSSDMQKQRYALVAYVNGPAGEFVESLRRELHPDLPHLAAHLTILPPRLLQGSEASALEVVERVCGRTEPFEVALGDVCTFAPVTPTLYIQVDFAACMCDLHGILDIEALAFKEEWPYIPHMTIAKLASVDQAREGFRLASERWAGYRGSRRILLEKLSFVREESPNCWVDLAQVQLGKRLVSR